MQFFNGRFSIFNNRKVAHLCPIVAVERAVIDRLADVRRGNVRARFQIGDGARDLENPVVRASRQALPQHRALQQVFAFRIECAKPSNLRRRHRRIRVNFITAESFELYFARCYNALANRRRVFSRRNILAAQFFEINRRNVDVNVDSVEQRTGNLADVALNLRRRAAAFALRAEIAARASPRCQNAIM